jgi:hypothetical protein
LQIASSIKLRALSASEAEDRTFLASPRSPAKKAEAGAKVMQAGAHAMSIGTLDYIFDVPLKLPEEGLAIVHSHDRHDAHTLPGAQGFRAWIQSPDEEPLIESCDCGWSGLAHYRVVGAT